MANYYVDFANSIGNLTSATGWTFTNGSATVTCPAGEGDANNEIANGDYIRANGGTQWYKVTDRNVSGDEITITPVFQQANVGPVACNYNNADGSGADANAMVHPQQVSDDIVIAPGDIVYVRANQTHQLGGADITMLEDGTAAAPIIFFGCDSVTDPWGDASDVHPIFDFNDTNFHCNFNGEDFWWFENLDLIQSADSYGALYTAGVGLKITDCVFRDNSGRGLYVSSGQIIGIYDSLFYSNKTYNLYIGSAYVNEISGCSFGGGAATTDYGIYNAGVVRIISDCSFGSAVAPMTAHDIASIYVLSPCMTFRRCLFSDATEFYFYSVQPFNKAYSEDHDQVVGAYKTFLFNGTWERSVAAGDPRAGGSAAAIKVTPNSNCLPNFPIMVQEWEEQSVPASEQTRGVCIQVRTNPGAYPTAAQLYLEAEYYNHAVNDTVTTAVSTAVLAANDTWVWFPVVFTPAQVQKVRYRVYLGVQKNAEYYCIDNQLYDADPT